MRALRLGLEMKQYGYNIFVNGVSGTGRTTAIKLLLKEFEQHQAVLDDKCYVHNFHDPDSPLMISLPAGKGTGFKNDMATFVNELLKAVPAVFESRRYQDERKRMLEHFQDRQRSVLKDFERRVREQGFEVVQVQAGPGVRPEIAPVVDGTPTNLEQLQAKVDKGELTEGDVNRLAAQQSELEGQMELVMREMRTIERKAKNSLDQLNHKTVVPLVEELMDELRKKYTTDKLTTYLNEVRDNVLSNIGRFHQKEEQQPTMSVCRWSVRKTTFWSTK